ncbi:MAG: inner membrane protein YpjD [Coriobacteriia bacterium]
MSQASAALFWLAFAFYCSASVLYWYRFVLRRENAGRWATLLTGSGFIAQTLSIGAGSIATGGTRLTGSNQLILASWALVLLYFIAEHLLRIKTYGVFLVPLAMVGMAIAQIVGAAEPSQLTPVQEMQLAGWRVAAHVALIVFANAAFALGALASALYLLQRRLLKNRASAGLTWRLPSLQSLQTIARRAVTLAFPIYTIGLLMGILQAIEVRVVFWYLDPRILMAAVVWAVFGTYLVAVHRPGVQSRTPARIALAGFALVILLTVVARIPAPGFHLFGL